MQRKLPRTLRNGLKLYLNGRYSGTSAYDDSNNGNTCTLNNAPVKKRRGGLEGYSYNGTNQTISAPAGVRSIFNYGNYHSVTMVFKTSSASGYAPLFYATDGSVGSIMLKMNNGAITIERRGSPNTFNTSCSGTYNDGRYHVLTYTFGANQKLYVDGTLVGDTNVYNASVGSITSTNFGGLGFNYWFPGEILSILVHNRELSSFEARQANEALYMVPQ